MNSNAWLSIVLLALALILPLAALRSHRLPVSKILKMGAMWVAVFLVVAFVISLVHPS